MNVVLVHPIHGAKVAINELEMEQDLKNGWSEYTPDPPVENPPPIVELVTTRKYTRKVTDPSIKLVTDVPQFLASRVDDKKEE